MDEKRKRRLGAGDFRFWDKEPKRSTDPVAILLCAISSSAVEHGILSLMASANLDFVRSLYSAWGRGDFSSAEWADPEIDFVIADGPARGSWVGLAGMAAGWRSWLSAWEDLRIEVDEYRELDDERVLVLAQGFARGKTSALETARLRSQAASLFHMRGGKVTKMVIYFDRHRAFSELGISREGGS